VYFTKQRKETGGENLDEMSSSQFLPKMQKNATVKRQGLLHAEGSMGGPQRGHIGTRPLDNEPTSLGCPTASG